MRLRSSLFSVALVGLLAVTACSGSDSGTVSSVPAVETTSEENSAGLVAPVVVDPATLDPALLADPDAPIADLTLAQIDQLAAVEVPPDVEDSAGTLGDLTVAAIDTATPPATVIPTLFRKPTVQTGSVGAQPSSLALVAPKVGKWIATLGDSYSSGEGSGGPWTVDKNHAGCDVSKKSWAYNWASASWKVYMYACQGAVTANLVSKSYDPDDSSDGCALSCRPTFANPVIYGGPYGPQITKLQSTIKSLGTVPKYITFTIGGNDLFFGKIAEGCYKKAHHLFGGDNCGRYLAKAKSSLAKNGHFKRVTQVIRNLRKIAPNSRVIIVGYPPLIEKANFQGGVQCPFNSSDAKAIRKLADTMATQASAAAGEENATYVDMRKAFSGHLLCRKASLANNTEYIVSISAWTGNNAGHPSAQGYSAMANEIYSVVRPPRTATGRTLKSAVGAKVVLPYVPDTEAYGAALPAPTGVTATGAGATTNVAWSPVVGASEYHVFTGELLPGGFWDQQEIGTSTSTSVSIDPSLLGSGCVVVTATSDDISDDSPGSKEACLSGATITNGVSDPTFPTYVPSIVVDQALPPVITELDYINTRPTVTSATGGSCKGGPRTLNLRNYAADVDGTIRSFRVSTSFGQATYKYSLDPVSGVVGFTIPLNNTAANVLTFTFYATDDMGTESLAGTIKITPVSKTCV